MRDAGSGIRSPRRTILLPRVCIRDDLRRPADPASRIPDPGERSTAPSYAPEGAHDASRIVRGKQLGDGGERLVAGAAVRFDQRARRGAEARAADRIAEQIRAARARASRPVRTWNRGAVVEKRLRDLGEVLHVRTKDNWLPEDCRLEDIVASGVDEAAADEYDRRHLIELGQLADGVER